MTNQERAPTHTKSDASARERLIAAAYRIIAERGLEAATVKEIARVSGVNQGLVHYYFGSKEGLLAAVVREAARRASREMAALRVATPSGALPVAALDRVKQRTEQEPDDYRLRYELFALALRHPALQEEVARLLAEGRAGIGHGVQAALGDRFSDGEGLAAVLLAAYDGLALQKVIDPEFDLHGAYQALSRLVAGLAITK